MQSRKIGVLLGGMSSEREVSLRTGEAVLAALRERGHRAVPIYVDRDVDVALRRLPAHQRLFQSIGNGCDGKEDDVGSARPVDDRNSRTIDLQRPIAGYCVGDLQR